MPNRLILSKKPKFSRFSLSAEVAHNLTFWLCLIELVDIKAMVRTVSLDIASPKVRWYAPSGDGCV